MHRARFVFREADNVVAQVAMELLAHAVQALRGVAGIQARRPERFALLNRHFARQIERFGLQIAATVGFRFRAGGGYRSSPDARPRRHPAFR
jgi:hypothetical protein